MLRSRRSSAARAALRSRATRRQRARSSIGSVRPPAVSFDPLTFIERLAALVPPPRAHQLTYHGVLAPASAWRDLV
ncbi:MAG: hypothetical protein FJ253_10870, partial [Phycisphaerae bacterium]|nr:hypothetical protein [Phycisphaerae bacterium]